MSELHIAELCFDDGAVKCRYSRYLSDDGSRWIRHGLFVQYYQDGTIASEGNYEHGLEHGRWRDFHQNGEQAAEGHYEDGVHIGVWRFWAPDGREEESVDHG